MINELGTAVTNLDEVTMGDRIINDVFDAIAEEYIVFMRQYDFSSAIPYWLRRLVTPNVILSAIQELKVAIHKLPPHVKRRIAVRVKSHVDAIANAYVDSFLLSQPDESLADLLKSMGWLK